jgi:hypothetical protein
MLFSAELLWCLIFCAEIQLSGKIPENIAKLQFYQKTHGARRRDGEEPRGEAAPYAADLDMRAEEQDILDTARRRHVP